MNKIALPKPVKIQNDEDFKSAANLIAETDVTLRKMIAMRDRAIQEVQERLNPEIDALSKALGSLVKPAKTYLTRHKKRIFQGGKKTMKTELALIKIRQNPDKISTIGKVKQDEVAGQLAEQGLDHLITISYSLNKVALLKLSDEKLAEFNLKKTASETITLDPLTKQLDES